MHPEKVVDSTDTKRLAEESKFCQPVPDKAARVHAWHGCRLLLPRAGPQYTGAAPQQLPVWRFSVNNADFPVKGAASKFATQWMKAVFFFLKVPFCSSCNVGCTERLLRIPLVLGGLGLRSAATTSQSAFWASWSDCLHMIAERHPAVARDVVRRLEEGGGTGSVNAAVEAAPHLTRVTGLEPPSWAALVEGALPPPREPEDFEPGTQRRGWQHEASSRVERHFRESQLFPVLTQSERAC